MRPFAFVKDLDRFALAHVTDVTAVGKYLDDDHY